MDVSAEADTADAVGESTPAQAAPAAAGTDTNGGGNAGGEAKGAKPKKRRANIQCVVRIRPPQPHETTYITCNPKSGDELTFQMEKVPHKEDGKPHATPPDYTRAFRAVLGPKGSQADVFRTCGIPLVEAALKGQKSCFFAYGQTGSGKTFSMYGAEGGKNPSKLDGAVPAICAELFRRKFDLEKRKDFRLDIEATLVEVQGTKIVDLLSSTPASGEQPTCRMVGSEVHGCKRETIHSSRGLTHLIERGMARRTTHQNYSTQNVHSSRSHAFLTLFLTRHTLHGSEIQDSSTTKMCMVDLAGSEKFDEAFKDEGGKINASLLALGKVLTALKEESHHVPFRDSMLTMMLRDSLESACVTRVLACLNPGVDTFAETRNVLIYVHRASSVDDDEPEEVVLKTYDDIQRMQRAGKPAFYDPMANDVYDADEAQNRRVEDIVTENYGSVYARISGDPLDPLLLYIHGSNIAKKAECTSKMWNDQVAAMAAQMAMAEKHAVEQKMAAAAAATNTWWRSSTKEANRRAVAGAKGAPTAGEPSAMDGGASPSTTSSETRRPSQHATPPSVLPKPASRAANEANATPRFQARARKNGGKKRGAAARPPVGLPPTPVHQMSAKDKEDASLAERAGTMRSTLAISLRMRQKEIARQAVCSRCAATLVKPTRLTPCRHVLCALCVEQTVRYFQDCPVCRVELQTDPLLDEAHAEVMRRRLANLRAPPPSVAVDAAKVETATRERERSNRLVLEFGADAVGGEVCAYVRLVQTADGVVIHHGAHAAVRPSEDAIDHVTLEMRDVSLRAKNDKGKPVRRKRRSLVEMLSGGEAAEVADAVSEPSTRDVALVTTNDKGKPVRRKRRSLTETLFGGEAAEVAGAVPEPAALEGEKTLRVPNHERLGYVATRPPQLTRFVCVITVHWHAEWEMAPFQIRLASPADGDTQRRRVVVTLPSDIAAGNGRAHVNGHGHVLPSEPLIYESSSPDLPLQSAWVHYQRGTHGSGAQGTIHPLKATEKARGDMRTELLAAKWLDRLMGDTEDEAIEAIGRLVDVQRVLVFGASLGLPFATLPEAYLASKTVPDPNLQALLRGTPQLMLRSVCAGVDPSIREQYEQMVQVIKLRGGVLDGLLVGQDHEDAGAAHRPKAFFQVAIDVPGYGDSKGSPQPDFVPTKLLKEVIRALGKEYAYAIVTCSHAAANVLNALLQVPSLASFLVLRDPSLEDTQIDGFYGLLHPVLLPYDPEGGTQQLRVGRNMNTVLPQMTSPKFSHKESPKYFKTQFATDVFKFFEIHEWHGAMRGLGHSEHLALLTRLAGGYDAYRGEKRERRKSVVGMILRRTSAVGAADHLAVGGGGGAHRRPSVLEALTSAWTSSCHTHQASEGDGGGRGGGSGEGGGGAKAPRRTSIQMLVETAKTRGHRAGLFVSAIGDLVPQALLPAALAEGRLARQSSMERLKVAKK